MNDEKQNKSDRMILLQEQYVQFENELTGLYGRREMINETIKQREQIMHEIRGAINECRFNEMKRDLQ